MRQFKILRHALILLATSLCFFYHSTASYGQELAAHKKASTITVTGHVARGVRARYGQGMAHLGPLGNKEILNTPFSMEVIPQDLKVNQQARNIEELAQYLPSTQVEMRGSPDTARPQTRGFEGGIISNTRIDGLNALATTPYPAEEFSELQVLNGLSGALYGTQNPAGTFNYILKRPTDHLKERMLVGVDSIGALMENADVSDRRDWFGYRINLLHGSGTAYSQSSSLRRDMANVDLDFHIDNQTLLQTDISHYTYAQRGMAPGFGITSRLASLPQAPDLGRPFLGQEYGGFNSTTDSFLAKLYHQITPDWRFTLGGLYQNARRHIFENADIFTDGAGDYRQTDSASPAADDFKVNSRLAYVNGHVRSGFLDHDIVVGTNGYDVEAYNPLKTQTLQAPGIYNINAPQRINGHQPGNWGGYHSGHIENESFILGDTITVDPHWSFMGLLSWSWMQTNSWRNPTSKGAKNTRYRENGAFTPSASVIYKPDNNQTAYFTYGRSLQPGMIAPPGSRNENSITAPLPSDEYEIGYKIHYKQLQFSVDGFRMTRAYGFTDPVSQNFGLNGQQKNYGAEALAAGKIFPNFSILVGMTWLDAKLENTSSPQTSHKDVVGVPPWQANILLDYQMPYQLGKLASRFAFNANIHYTGTRFANVENTLRANGYTTLDLGVRYRFAAAGIPWVARFTVSNVANARYWASIYPMSINGGLGASSSAYAGLPRMYHFSLEADF